MNCACGWLITYRSPALHPIRLYGIARVCVLCLVLQRRAYRIKSWEDTDDFLAQLARSSGKLLKGGDPDLNTAARMVLYDWQRGKIPFYTLPPDYTEQPPAAAGAGTAVADHADDADAADGSTPQEEDAEGDEAAAGGIFKEAVTADDAAAEAGARPENAAAAAAALRDAAATALRRQRRGAIPIKEGYFLPGDELGDDEQQGSDDADAVSTDGSEGDNSDDADDASEPAGSGSEAELDSDAGGVSDGDAAAHQQQPQPSNKRKLRAAAAAAAAGGDSGAESDGYGDAGLSWEAVLQAVQVST